MVERVYLKAFIIVLIATTIKADFFGIVGDLVCTATAANQIKTCGEDFNKEVRDANNQMTEELQTRKFCCAFNHMRDCIVDAIGDKCGDSRDSIVTKVISSFIGEAKDSTRVDCQYYTGTTSKVLCLSDFLLILIGIGVVLLFLFVCCGTIKMCCGSSRGTSGGRNSAQFVLLPQHNADKSRY